MPVQGSNGSGTVAVRAVAGNGAMAIQSCVVSAGGRQINIDPSGADGGGGGGGGGGDGGGGGVIDVDVIDVGVDV